MERKHKQKYLKVWERINVLRGWLREVPNNKHAAYCDWCCKTLDAHRSLLLRHSRSKFHLKNSPFLIKNNNNLQLSYYSDKIEDKFDLSQSLIMKTEENSVDTNTIDESNISFDDTLNYELDLHTVISMLKKLIPLELAADWDNVGLLIEPSEMVFVKRILLTNDLTEKVLDEAISKDVNLIISYHPPLFKPFKTLTQSSWKERVAIRCISKNIAVYSPHTALDAVKGGINDWLLSPFYCSEVNPIERCDIIPQKIKTCAYQYSISFFTENKELIEELQTLEISLQEETSGNYCISCNYDSLHEVLDIFNKNDIFCKSINKQPKLPLHHEGMGRIGKLCDPLSIEEIVETLKQFLGLDYLRLALSNIHTKDSLVNSIGVCAGSGASVLQKVSADLFISGEMSHHEVLDFVHKGSSVILCEHSNSERGYLKAALHKMLFEKLKINVLISELDSDPINIA